MKSLLLAFAIGIFIAIYGGFHVYAYRKLRYVFPRHRRTVIVILSILGLSIFIVEIFTHGNVHSVLVEPLSWVTFTWMGYVFLFFAVSVLLDLVQKISGFTGCAVISDRLASPRRTMVVIAVVTVIAGYGIAAARQINVEHIVLESAKVQNTIRIVQLADLHLGVLSQERYISRVVDTVNRLEPDVIVSTGDLVDMQLDHLQALLEQMQRCTAKWGKYAVYGNHEYLAGINAARDFTQAAGFDILSNRGISVNAALNIVGIDDQSIEQGSGRVADFDEAALLRKFDNGLFTLLLKHQPVIELSSVGLFDLQLSGHIHGGQIFPFGLLTWLYYQVPLGLSRVTESGWIYVSRGTGTWGPPMRVLAPPEITLIEIQPAIVNE
ncbi:MAG: hypothetical protein AMJ55_10625 [Gammaproteobacteria bacterium SG8_15]|nr:MAG: hypothetical protein AMJ55_10625 [Gammaproteobacteria bacterium SG8_15]